MKRAALVVTLILAAGAGLLVAGPLNPPAGAVSSSYKTLSEVEPRIPISAATTPGDADSVYKITAPGSYYLTGNIQGVTGKHGIEIAVGGVSIDLAGFAVLGVAGSLDGITVPGQNRPDIAVTNGSVRGWGGDGVDLAYVIGARVSNVAASANGLIGIHAGKGASVTSCTASSNTQSGIIVSDGGAISGCAAYDNGAYGITAIGATVADCTASFNTMTGIYASEGATVTGCSVFSNTSHGIQVQDNTLIRANNCYENGANPDTAGIYVWGSGNRIEDNNCTQGDKGIMVIDSGNVIVRNTCGGNTTNWYITVGNIHGPIVDRTAPVAPLVTGNSGGDTTASTHPNANFSY